MPWSQFSECWVLSQLFHSLLSLSSRGSLVLLRLGPNPTTGTFIRKGERDLDRHKETQERQPQENTGRQEQGTHKPRNAEEPSVLGESKEGFSHGASRGSTALPTPWFWTSGLLARTEQISVVLSHKFVVICYGSPRKLTHCPSNSNPHCFQTLPPYISRVFFPLPTFQIIIASLFVLPFHWKDFPVAQTVKNLPAMRET